MFQIVNKATERQRTAAVIAISVLGAAGLYLFGTFAMADAGQMIDAVVTIVSRIAQVVGVIFGIVGLLRFVIAHSNENAGDQQKAAMMIATGIILVVVPAILTAIPWSSMVN